MATIKGQNLRLLVGSPIRCIAKAQSCTLHLAMEVQESSTKDDVDGWVRNEVTGMSWDVTAEADVTASEMDLNTTVATGISTAGLQYRTAEKISLNAGQRIHYNAQGTQQDYPIFGVIDTEGNVVVAPKRGGDYYTAASNIDVYITSDRTNLVGGELSFDTEGNSTDQLVELMKSKELVNVRFSKTNGAQNREEDQMLYKGAAYINDISIQSVNRQTATATIQMIGVGDLEEVNNED